MKFVLFVEGPTEKKALPQFLKRWLDPRLPQPVGIKVVRFDGWRDYLNGIETKVALNLSGRAGADVIAGIGLLDLYGPTFYPAHCRTVAQRYAWAKEDIERTANHQRFRQHFAVHETEAWLLAELAIFPAEVRSAFPGRCAQPETVNFDQPPASLLNSIYERRMGRRYKKVTDGADLFTALTPEAASASCPYLRQLMEEMLALAQFGKQP